MANALFQGEPNNTMSIDLGLLQFWLSREPSTLSV